MHLRPLRTVRGSHAICSLAAALVIIACSDSSTGTRTPAPLVDDRLIAFVSDSGFCCGYSSIFVSHADGTHKTQLTSGYFHDDLPAWSPDGSTIAFTTDRSPAGIWVVTVDGSNLRPLVTAPDFLDAAQPAWSPNSLSIAFSAAVKDSLDVFISVIMIADADGSHARRLTTNAGNAEWPSWSPDGTRIAFDAAADFAAQHIFVVGTDGTAQRQLTNGLDIQPRWSPDGGRISFTSVNTDDPKSLAQVWMMQENGSDRRALTSGGTFRAPAWSPDGRQLEYQGFTPDTGGPNPVRIFRANADGSDAHGITFDGYGYLPIFSSWSPAWKPAP
jgi:TolB protein